MNKQSVTFSLRIYLILTGMLLLSAVLFLTHTQYFQQFTHNREIGARITQSKSAAAAAVDDSSLSVCLIYDGDEPYSVRVKKEVAKAMQDIRKPTADFDLRSKQPDLTGCMAAVTTMTDLTSVETNGPG